MVRLGQTFVNKAGSGVPSHLWMVLSNPHQNKRVVIANLSTQPGHDSNLAYIVKPREHRYVSGDSFVRCDHARIANVEQLEEARTNGLLSPSDDLSETLLKKAQKALGESPLVPNEVKDILRAQGFI